MKKAQFIKAIRAGALDIVRETGMLLHHLDDLEELGPEQMGQAAEDLANARECLDQISLGAGNLSDQAHKAEQVIASEQLRAAAV